MCIRLLLLHMLNLFSTSTIKKEKWNEIVICTYLVQLHFFQTTVSLFLVVHIKDFDQFHGDDGFVFYVFSFKNI